MGRWILYSLLAYCALYAAVWLHELGHALLNARFGCRPGWSRVQVKPYVFFSNPGPVDLDKYRALAPWQRTLAAYGGVIANLLWAGAGGALLLLLQPENGYVQLFLWMFTTLHLAEIVSYLVVGSIYLVSDMAIAVQEYPCLRLPNIAAGLAVTAVYLWALLRVPADFRVFAAVWNLLTVLSMCAGRIVFSLLHRNAS